MYKYEYNSLHDLLTLAEKEGTTLADIVVRHEVESSEVSEEKVRAMMDSRLDVFQESIDAGMNDPGKSVSGLVGGDAHKLAESTPTLLGALAHKAAIYALAVSEANAKMFKIVACPTAGSCGIVPAVMMAEAETLNISRDAMVDALFIASGIGAVVSHNATVAGAVGGCQAECGTAAAMAAATRMYFIEPLFIVSSPLFLHSAYISFISPLGNSVQHGKHLIALCFIKTFYEIGNPRF